MRTIYCIQILHSPFVRPRVMPALLRGLAAATACLCLAASAQTPPALVYSNSFEAVPGPEWTTNKRSTTPTGARRFLGDFGNQTVTLNLTNLPPHTVAQVTCDLFVLRSWDGNATFIAAGPDVWSLGVSGGPLLLSTTFDNHAVGEQAFPGAYPGDRFPRQAGAAEVGTLGYELDYAGEDAVYRIAATFEHAAANLALNFAGAGLEALANESWGLDNVQVTVLSNAVGVIQFKASTVAAVENAAVAVLHVERIGGSQGVVTVDCATADVTATAGTDYAARNGTLTFDAGETNKTVVLSILEDAVAEVTEYFQVTLSHPTGGVDLGRDTAIVSVLDDQGFVELSPTTAYVTELEGGIAFNVLWTGNTNGAAAVRLRSSDETARGAGVDYWPVDTLVTFAPGETSKSVTVYVNDDSLAEPEESFLLELSEPSSSVNLNANRQARVWVVDDDTSAGPGCGANWQVKTLAVQSDSRVLIGGGFWKVNGVDRSGIARLHPDGSLDTSFDPLSGANDWVEGITLVADGKILIAGSFTSVSGQSRNRIARLNPNGSLDTSFAPSSGANNTVYKVLLTPANKVLLVGAFTTVNGVTRNRIARLNADGSLDSTFNPGSGANNTIWAIATQSDGRIIVSGAFTTFNGASRVRLARLNPDGSLDNTFGVGAGMNARANVILPLADDRLILGGLFTTINGASAVRLARLNANGSLDSTFSVGTGPNSTIWCLCRQPDGKILAGGEFTTWNGASQGHLARVNADGSFDVSLATGAGANGYVGGVGALPDGRVAVAGDFDLFDGALRERFALVNPDGGLPPNAVQWLQWRATDGGNDHWYAFTPLATAWNVAEAEAASRGGHLADVQSAAEQNFLVTNFLHGPNLLRPFWIGLSDARVEGRFAWSSGAPLVYTRWTPGEPNDYGGDEDYAALSWHFSESWRLPLGAWNDTPWNGTAIGSTGSDGPYYGLMELPLSPPLGGPVAAYAEDFEGAVGPEWSLSTTSETPAGGRRFLGTFLNQPVRLALSNLPPHTVVRLALDLFVIGSWDGNHRVNGPDVWRLLLTGGAWSLQTTFNNHYPVPGPKFDEGIAAGQAFPLSYTASLATSALPPLTGAAEINTLGYTYSFAGLTAPVTMDSVYRFSRTLPHTNATLEVTFSASGLTDESWGLDNVRVELYNPAAADLLTLAFQPIDPLYVGDPVPRVPALIATFNQAILDLAQSADVSLSSSDPGVFTVDSSGLLLPRAAGSAQLIASYQSLSATAAVSVLAPVVLHQALPSPIYAGGVPATVRLLADFPGAANIDVTGFNGVVRSSSDPEIAAIAANGLLSPRKAGTAVLTASFAGLTDTTPVTVLLALGFRAGTLAHRYSFSGLPGVSEVTDSVGGAHGEVINLHPGSATDNFSGTGFLRLAGGANSAGDPFAAYANLPNGLVSGRPSVTLEGWVTWNGPTASTWQRIFDFGRDSATDALGAFAEDAFAPTGVGYMFLTPYAGSTLARFGIRPAGVNTEYVNLDGPSAMPIGVETHFAVVYDPPSGVARFYLNGRCVNLAAMALPLSAVEDLNMWLGRSQFRADPFFDGSFNEFRIYDGALLDAQIIASYAAGPDVYSGPVSSPANDRFDQEFPLSGSDVLARGTSLNASREPVEPAHAGSTGWSSVWWTWTAPANGLVLVDTAGSSFDTLLAVYTGNVVSSLTVVADNDNHGTNRTSLVSFMGAAGVAYSIAVDGPPGAAGGVVLHLVQPPPTGPQVSSGPESHTTAVGYPVSFDLVAEGQPPIHCQWQKDGVDIPGATNARCAIAQVQAADAGSYRVAMTNALGSAISPTANQTVIEPYVFSTLAGMPGTAGTANGTGTAARFNSPHDIALGRTGTVYVCDAGNHTIRKITPSGVVSTLAGLAQSPGTADGAGSAARFRTPLGLTVDDAGNVFVADSGNHTLRKIASNGTVTTLAGLAGTAGSANGTGTAARFNYPRDVAVDAAGNILVADYNNHTIRKVSPAGVVTTLAGQAGAIGAIDGLGAEARFNQPASLAIDTTDVLFVGDLNNCTIRKVTPAGQVSTWAGLAPMNGSTDGPGNSARFNSPSGLALDSAGNVFVADFWSSTIRRVSSLGEVSTLGGLAGVAGTTDARGALARFRFPRGIASDAAGNVYVADYSNHTIRKGVPSAGILIQEQPVSLVYSETGMADLRVVAAGESPLAYQWFFNGSPLAGATQPSLHLDHLTRTQTGTYRARIRTLDGLEEVWSDSVSLVVQELSWQWAGTPGLPSGVGLHSVWARTATDAFALGAKRRSHRVDIPDASLYHWDGSAWSLAGTFPGFYAGRVFGTGSNEVWLTLNRCAAGPAAGCGTDRGGRVLRSVDNGALWTEQSLPAEIGNLELGAIRGTPTDVHVVVQGGSILRFDGAQWSTVFSDPLQGVSALTLLSPNEGYYVTSSGWGAWDGHAWRFNGPQFEFAEIADTWALRDTRGLHWLAVGANHNANGVRIWQFSESTQSFGGQTNVVFSEGDSADLGRATGVWGAAADDVFVIGELAVAPGTARSGRLYHFDGATWSPVTDFGEIPPATSLHGSAFDDVWITLNDGRLLHRGPGGGTNDPPGITTPPQDLSVAAGDNATLAMVARGTPPLHYQWYTADGAVLPGATNPILVLPEVQPAHAGTYWVLVTNPFGAATAGPVALTVLVPPIITAQPQGTNLTAGGELVLRVSATGATDYQWLKDGTNLAGATDSIFGVVHAQTRDSGRYSVVVANDAAAVTSDPADVTVAPLVGPIVIQTPEVVPGQSCTLRWKAEPSATYRLLYTDDLQTLPWRLLSEVTSLGDEAMFTDLTLTTRRFYQIQSGP